MRVAGEELRTELENKGMSLADAAVSGIETEELGVLNGGDSYWDIVSGKTERLSKGMVAIDSKFGWLIQGTVTVDFACAEPTETDIMHVSVEDINNTLRSFWDLESIGITAKKKTPAWTILQDKSLPKLCASKMDVMR